MVTENPHTPPYTSRTSSSVLLAYRWIYDSRTRCARSLWPGYMLLYLRFEHFVLRQWYEVTFILITNSLWRRCWVLIMFRTGRDIRGLPRLSQYDCRHHVRYVMILFPFETNWLTTVLGAAFDIVQGIYADSKPERFPRPPHICLL